MNSKKISRILKILLIVMMSALGPMPMPWIEREQISKVKTEQVEHREDDDEEW